MKKRTIIVDIAIVFIFSLCLYFLITEIQGISNSSKWLLEHLDSLNRKLENPDSIGNTLEELQRWVTSAQNRILIEAIWIAIFSFSIISCVFIFVYCNPKLFRRSTWTNLSDEWAKNKAERLAAKQAREEEAKQKRIEELQAELSALNNSDENN